MQQSAIPVLKRIRVGILSYVLKLADIGYTPQQTEKETVADRNPCIGYRRVKEAPD